MSETKTKWTIPKTTVAQLKDISSKFSQLNTGMVGDEFWIIVADDTEGDYEGAGIAVGINKQGQLIQAQDSHCSCNGNFDGGFEAFGNQKLEGALTVEFDTYYTFDNWLPELKKTASTLYKVLNGKSVNMQEVIGLPNAEIRRAVFEIVGYNKLTEHAKVKDVSDIDGRLMVVELQDDEDLALLHVKDPSTTREYFLRVPPQMKTAKQARAWTFGFEAEDFSLTRET